jgi:predicted amidohydrolase
MKIGYLQFQPLFGNVAANINKIDNMIDGKEFDLLVLPELSNAGYYFTEKKELEKYSETPESGVFCNFLKDYACRNNCFIVAGFCEKSNDKYYNSAITVFPDKSYKIYRKVHLFYKEKFLFDPGNKKFEVFDISSERFGTAKIGVMICFDWVFPEAARTLALKGAQIICHPSNLVMPYCQKTMYARAVENHVFIITTNRIGTETRNNEELIFTGGSVILDPKGNYLSKGTINEEELNIVEINQNDADDKFINKFNNVITDRREEFYYK